MSTKFELAIIVLIILNMIAMAFEHYGQPESYDDALDLLNIVFTTIFTLEALVKIMGLRWHYFRRAWNIYDFIICIVSIIGKRRYINIEILILIYVILLNKNFNIFFFGSF